MERIYKIAINLHKLKFTYGLKPIKVSGVNPTKYFDYIFTKYNLNDVLEVQEKVKEEIETAFLKGVEANKLIFYAAIHLVLEPYRKGFLQSFDTGSWQRSECPFCGSRAGIAHIADNGKRKLICHFCWTEWEYPRLKCFNCGSDHTEYALFEVDRHEVRIDYCDVCNNYVKTVSFEFSEDPFVVWDLKTLTLDDWAAEKGYKKPTPSLIGIDFKK